MGKKSKGKKKVFKRVLLGLTFVITVSGGVVSGVFVAKVKPIIDECRVEAYDKLSTVNNGVFNLIDRTNIYADDGTLISKLEVRDYNYVSVDKIPSLLQNGYISVEDKRFLAHNGVDLKALVNAGVSYFRIKVLGQDVQLRGGSTLTQQVIKNTLLTQDQTIKRKIVEMFIAPELEKKYSKADIMEFYLNTCYYGDGMYGVGSASKYYFNKDVEDLTLGEIALLIGMSNNPTLYSPVYNLETSLEKRKVTLNTMLMDGVITQEEHDNAVNEEVKLYCVASERTNESYLTSYAIHSTVLQLMEDDNFEFKYGILSDIDYQAYIEKYREEYAKYDAKVRNGGYNIYTSLNLKKQEALQKAVDDTLSINTETDKISGKYTLQAGAVSVNNETGLVDAIVGGRGTEDEFNRGFLAKRQPGSTMKPLVAYGVAFDTGKFYPSYMYTDSAIDGGPENYDKVYRGKMSLREALVRSNNTIPFKLMIELRAQTGFEYLAKMKFDTLREGDNTAVLALGGMTDGVRVVDMAKAYSTLVNGGIYSDGTCITKLETSQGEIIYDGEQEKIKVYEEDSAYMLIDILKGTLEDSNLGLAKTLKINGVTAAAKTGTTNDEKDSWFCGMTAYNTTAIWVGYDIPATIPDLVQNKYSGVIWNKYLTEISKGYTNKDFEKPKTIEESYVDGNGNRVSYTTSKKDLFSSVGTSKVQEEIEQDKIDRIKETEKELVKLEEDRKIKAEGLVKQYEGLTIASIGDLDIADTAYTEAKYSISSILDDVTREKLTNRLETKKKALENDYNTWVNVKNESKQQEYAELAKEEEERQLAIAEGYDKAISVLVSEAETAIEVLKKLEVADETRYYYFKDAELKVEKCKSANAYRDLLKNLNTEKIRLEIKIN